MNTILNFITGLIGFVSWFYLVNKSPEHGLTLALGVLLILLGFGGRETIQEILKTWRE
ncbi:MAG: hypothetical protein ACRC0X_09325 [Brevinema sp.]